MLLKIKGSFVFRLCSLDTRCIDECLDITVMEKMRLVSDYYIVIVMEEESRESSSVFCGFSYSESDASKSRSYNDICLNGKGIESYTIFVYV